MTSLAIPNSVTTIEDYAFYGCLGLSSVSIGNSVTSIGNFAFGNCSGLTSMFVEAGNTHYDSRNNSNAIIETATNTLIAGCKNTVIPKNVTGIGDYAFYGCTSLASIEIPNSITSIGLKVFSYCIGLTSIVVDAGNIRYDSRNNCNAIIETATNTLIASCKNTVIPNSITTIGDWAFQGCTNLTSMEIPNTVTSIGEGAFYGCMGLTSMEIPKSVTSIGIGVFADCKSLTSIVVDAGNIYYDSRENCNAIIETSTGTLIAGCKNTVIPNSVTSIGRCAFYRGTGLTSIEIPNSVTIIGDEAFRYCTDLTSIEIPNSVTSIGYCALGQCTGLTNIKMMSATPPDTGDYLFFNCTNLATIYVPKGAKEAYNVEPWNSYEIVEMDDTGIAAAPTADNQKANAPVYDLNGRRVGTADAIGTLPKGVYIVNGKKLLR